MEELFQGRRAFTEEQWIDVLLRSTGMEPTNFDERVKWHLLARMIPLVENNYNLLRAWPAGHRQEPHLQGNQPEQHPDLGRADDRRQPVLQHGPPHGRPGRPVGRGGVRRGGGHLLQGQGWRPDHEGLHGLGVVRPWPGCRSTPTPRWSSSATSTSRSIRWSRRATCSPRSPRR